MVEARALEWGSKKDINVLNPPFDLVVASDCVYKQELFTPLLGISIPHSSPPTCPTPVPPLSPPLLNTSHIKSSM